MVFGRGVLALAIGSVLLLSSSGVTVMAQAQARTVEVHSKQFAFVPAEITLKKGEPVKVVLYSDDVPHSLAVEGLPIHLGAEKGHPTNTVLTPTAIGDFQGRCSKFCGSGHRNMHFVVHVVN